MADKKHGGARPGSGRAAFTPTDGQRSLVTALAGMLSHEDIASLIGPPGGIHLSTLKKYFPDELASGRARVDAICIQGLVRKMQSGDLGALCFYAKTRMGWREKPLEHRAVDAEGNDVAAAPITIVISRDEAAL